MRKALLLIFLSLTLIACGKKETLPPDASVKSSDPDFLFQESSSEPNIFMPLQTEYSLVNNLWVERGRDLAVYTDDASDPVFPESNYYEVQYNPGLNIVRLSFRFFQDANFEGEPLPADITYTCRIDLSASEVLEVKEESTDGNSSEIFRLSNETLLEIGKERVQLLKEHEDEFHTQASEQQQESETRENSVSH